MKAAVINRARSKDEPVFIYGWKNEHPRPVNTHEHPCEHPVFKMAWTPDEHPSGEHPVDEAGIAETQ